MLQLLYLLEDIVPNLDGVIGDLGIILLVFGLANAFLGYKIFKFLLAVMGFIVGGLSGVLVAAYSGAFNSETAISYFVVGAVLGAVLAGVFHSLGVLLVVGGMCGLIAFLITGDKDTALGIGIICGIISAVFEKYAIIISTSFFGGGAAATGIWYIGLSNGENLRIGGIGLIIVICGLIFQIWTLKKFRFGGDDLDNDSIISDLIEDSPEIVAHVLKKIPEIADGIIEFLKEYALILVPIFISLLLGILTKIFFVTMMGIMVTFILIIIEYMRCRKEKVLKIENFHRHSWEKNFDIMLGNGYILFLLPLIPVWFICYLIDSAFNAVGIFNDAGVILFIPIAIIVYIACYKLIDYEDKKDKALSNAVSPNNLKIKPNVSNSKIMYCMNCGNKFENNDVYCANCGAKRQQ
jgi:MFS family permease